MNKFFSALVRLSCVYVMTFSILSGMDRTSITNSQVKPRLTTADEGLNVLFATLKQARDQNSVSRFKKIMDEAQLSDLEPLWPQLVKLTVYSLPINSLDPATNNKFSLALQDYCEENESILHQTARKGALILLKKSIHQSIINNLNLSGETALFAAVRDEQYEAAKLLLEHGADARKPMTIGMIPLHMARTPELVDLLLKYAPHCLDIQDAYGQTPLFVAFTYRKAAVVHALLDRNANVNCTNVHGETILHGLCNKGFLTPTQSIDICKKILANGANVNCQANDGRTPLHVATENKLPALTYMLLKHGADPLLKDRWGDTPASSIQTSWECSPQEFITFFEQPHFAERMNTKKKAIAAKSFEITLPEHRKQQLKNKKKKKKKSTPTFAQSQEKKEAKKGQVIEAKKAELKSILPVEPIKETPHEPQLDFAVRVTNWWNAAWLEQKEAQAKAANCYSYWNFLRKRLYHRIPKETIAQILKNGDPETRPNKTFKDQMDTQHTIEGEMQFKYLDNPWAPGRQRQPGFYHVTRGRNNTIYHIGFKPIQNRGFRLADFMPQEEIPFKFVDAETDNYIAVHDPKEGVRHVLYKR